MDFDVHNSQMGAFIGRWSPTILNVTLEGANEDAVRKSVIYESSFGCDFLLSPKLPNATDVIPIDRFDEIFTVLRRMYDVIVIDTSVEYRNDLLSKLVYPMSDKIVYVATLDRPSIMNMRRWILFTGTS